MEVRGKRKLKAGGEKGKNLGGADSFWRTNKGNTTPSACAENGDWGLLSEHLKERPSKLRGALHKASQGITNGRRNTQAGWDAPVNTKDRSPGLVSDLAACLTRPQVAEQPGDSSPFLAPHLWVWHTRTLQGTKKSLCSTEWPLLSAFG